MPTARLPVGLLSVATLSSEPARGQQWREPDVVYGGPLAAGVHDPSRGVTVLMSSTFAPEFLVEWNGAQLYRRASAPGPAFRLHTAAVFDPQLGELLLSGGELATGGGLADAWSWNGRRWQQLPTGPGARWAHRMVHDRARQRVVLFGGDSQLGHLDDTWLWDGVAWTEARAAVRPPPRRDHAMAFEPVSGRVLLFGGRGISQSRPTVLSDTWEWDGTSWSEIHGAGGPARHATPIAEDPASGQLHFYGGETAAGGPSSELWNFVPSARRWSLVPQAGLPGARSHHALVRAGGSLLLIGGNETSTAPFPSLQTMTVWSWSGATWTRRRDEILPWGRSGALLVHDPARRRTVLFGGEAFPYADLLGDTWQWDGGLWLRSPPQPPAPRVRMQAAYDTARQRVLMHGGFSSQPAAVLADLWAFDGASWTLVDNFTSCGPRADGGLVWDGARQRLSLIHI